jgi:Protein of unknown function (DUF3307)
VPAFDAVIPFHQAVAVWLAFELKHFVADFVLQTDTLAKGKERVEGWLIPLTIHAGIHGVLALVVALVFVPHLWWIGLVDFGIHFCIDRGKSVAGRMGGWTIKQHMYWVLFGFDQFLHQVTNVALAMTLLAP